MVTMARENQKMAREARLAREARHDKRKAYAYQKRVKREDER